jgi:hypothetical protein
MLEFLMEVVLMKTTALLASAGTLVASSLLLSSLLVSSAAAQTRPSTNVPPPPGMNDPGVKATAPPVKASPPASTPTTAEKPLQLAPQALPSMKDGDRRLGRPADSVPDVSVRQQGENSIQEYRRNGQVYMVVVTPKRGLARTYMVDPQGRLVDEHGQRKATPAMYKVLEWGKPPKPAQTTSDDDGN